MMKVWHVSRDDNTGGASKAAYRLHVAMTQSNIYSHLRVLNRETANDLVIAGRPTRPFIEKLKSRLERLWREHTQRKFKTDNLILHSFGQESAGIVEELNRCDADILNLHWIVKFLSIKDISLLSKPLVWTFHDMWAFCGGEHVAPDDAQSRFRLGYLPDNRPPGESGPDLNRLTWESKRQAWANQNITVVTPGRWMAKCARESVLFKDCAVHVIPNPLDMQELWRPIPKLFARQALGLPINKKLVLTGSAGGMPHLKGVDLLKEAIAIASVGRSEQFELVVFGQYRPVSEADWPCPVHWLGPIKDDHVLATLYSAVDVMMVPSRQDNLPNTAIEAHACGIPVIAFNIGGLPDIVVHQESGWLANAFDTRDLAAGILWVLEDDKRWRYLSAAARKSAIDKYSEKVVTAQYLEVYEDILSSYRK